MIVPESDVTLRSTTKFMTSSGTTTSETEMSKGLLKFIGLWGTDIFMIEGLTCLIVESNIG